MVIEGRKEDGEVFYDKGVDPFLYLTIASVCMAIFKCNFWTKSWNGMTEEKDMAMDENSQPLKHDLQISGHNDWMLLRDGKPVEVTVDKWSVKFISSPITQVPVNGYSAKDQYSNVSIKCMGWIMEESRRAGQQTRIQHALNGGEKKIVVKEGTDIYISYIVPRQTRFTSTTPVFSTDTKSATQTAT